MIPKYIDTWTQTFFGHPYQALDIDSRSTVCPSFWGPKWHCGMAEGATSERRWSGEGTGPTGPGSACEAGKAGGVFIAACCPQGKTDLATLANTEVWFQLVSWIAEVVIRSSDGPNNSWRIVALPRMGEGGEGGDTQGFTPHDGGNYPDWSGGLRRCIGCAWYRHQPVFNSQHFRCSWLFGIEGTISHSDAYHAYHIPILLLLGLSSMNQLVTSDLWPVGVLQPRITLAFHPTTNPMTPSPSAMNRFKGLRIGNILTRNSVKVCASATQAVASESQAPSANACGSPHDDSTHHATFTVLDF